jgi:hypothetical protein
MAVAVIQDFPASDRDTINYDAIHAEIMNRADDPNGLIIHTAGFTESGFRIFEVWESQEQHDTFMSEVVMPAVMKVTAGNPGSPPQVSSYELHNVVVP